MLPTYCPSCRTIRQPNGTFCHICGYSYLTKTAVESNEAPPRNEKEGPLLRIGDGWRFGLGFMAVVTIFSIVFALVWSALLAAMLASMMRGFGL